MPEFLKIQKKTSWLTGILIILVAAMAWVVFSDYSETSEPKGSVEAEPVVESNGRFAKDNTEGIDADTSRVSRPVLKTLKPALDDLQLEDQNRAVSSGVPDDGGQAGRDRFYQTESGDTLWELAGRMDSFENSFRWPLLYRQNRQAVEHLIYNSSNRKWIAGMLSSSTLKLTPDPQPVRHSGKGFSGTVYAVQLLSLSEQKREMAYDITGKLINAGYCAYMYRTRDRIYAPSLGKAIHFYRIRVGPFKSATEATNAGEEILFEMAGTGLFPGKYWVTELTEREKSGRQLDFGVQRRNPWIFQISQHQNLQQALETFHMVEESADVAYIREASVIPYEKMYSVRVGFFPSEEAALKRFNVLQRQTGYQLEQYLPVELFDPFELIPAGF